MDLVDEGVLVADDVAGGPPHADIGVVALRHEDLTESTRIPGRLLLGEEDLELVQALHVERKRAFLAVDLDGVVIAAPVGEARSLQRTDRAIFKRHGGGEGVVHRNRTLAAVCRLALVGEGRRGGADGRQLADEEPRQIDDVRAEVANRAGSRLPSVEPPCHAESGVHEPVLQIAGAEVVDASEATFLDDLAHQPDGGHEAVVEAAHVNDAGSRGRLPHLS